MNIVAYTALHYGADYLGYAIRSVINSVDEYVVLYTPVGSHGHRTDEPCPDSRNTLFDIAQQAAGHKLRWIDSHWTHEGQQRDSIHRFAPDADIILTLDADEIWADDLAQYAIDTTIQSNTRRMRVPIIHYWRSFSRCVLHDPAFPERIWYRGGTVDYGTLDKSAGVINHFGYAQRPELIRYKLLTHGHRNEFRTDCDWYSDIYLPSRQTDCHPVGSEYWNPEPVDVLDYAPEWMSEHPYYEKELI